jgi:signal recognition particle subunit SRP54
MPMFENLSDRLQDVFGQLGRKGTLTEADVDTALREVRIALLEADVNLKVTKDFIRRVREGAIGSDVQKSLRPAQQVIKIVNDELIATLGEAGKLNLGGPSPRVIMLVGLQGSGKTTTAAKLALHLRRDNRKPWLVAADTYRPAAIDQLVTLAKQIDMPYYAETVQSSPPDICAHGVQAAKDAGATVVILDTAGRSMREVTGVPIKFLATGEKLDGFEVFHPDRLASRILGMGDMLSLIEQAEQLYDEEEAMRLQKKMMKNEFTLEDFLGQLQKIKRMGSFSKILDMIPGVGGIRKQLNMNDDEAQQRMKRVEAIILSMTPQERRNPKLLNASRKKRIAAGSGTTVQDINQLLNQFRDMQKMMKELGSGRMPKMPGMR